MALNSMNFHAMAPVVASGLLNSLVAGVGVVLVAWLVCRVAGRHSSRTRFSVWLITLIAMFFLPCLGYFAASFYAAVPTWASGALTLPESLASYLVIGWMIGATLGLCHIAHGLYRLRCLRATCAPVAAEELDPTLRAILSEIQPQRSAQLCVSDAVRVPAAIGYFRPLVVFPTWALAEIPTPELSAILLHELEHLRRYDDWTNLAQKLVKALLFFHPAVWFIESRLTLEREMACDDAVLAADFAPRAYAESLISLAEKSFLRRGVQLAQAAVSHVQQLKVRLAEILRKDRVVEGSVGGRKPGLALLSLAFMVAGYGALSAPRLVAFSDGSDARAAVTSPATMLPEPTPRLQPVNLRYPIVAAPVRGVVKGRTKVAHRNTEATPRSAFVQRAAVSRYVDAKPNSQTVLVSQKEPVVTPVLVVLEGEQFGINGPILWRLTVVHLTPAQQRVLSGGIPKQI
jgi:bla regulator protein blaR1